MLAILYTRETTTPSPVVYTAFNVGYVRFLQNVKVAAQSSEWRLQPTQMLYRAQIICLDIWE